MLTWKTHLINLMFTPWEANYILQIPLTHSRLRDFHHWHYTKNGIYRVRSGYYLACQQVHESRAGSSVANHSDWTNIWHLKVQQKIEVFLWKARQDTLTTNANLFRRMVGDGRVGLYHLQSKQIGTCSLIVNGCR